MKRERGETPVKKQREGSGRGMAELEGAGVAFWVSGFALLRSSERLLCATNVEQ